MLQAACEGTFFAFGDLGNRFGSLALFCCLGGISCLRPS
jgi:hypothetical protein